MKTTLLSLILLLISFSSFAMCGPFDENGNCIADILTEENKTEDDYISQVKEENSLNVYDSEGNIIDGTFEAQ